MKVLMFGWEFPPHISGGLGTACFGLTQSLVEQDVKVLFVAPRLYGDEPGKDIELINASDISIERPALTQRASPVQKTKLQPSVSEKRPKPEPRVGGTDSKFTHIQAPVDLSPYETPASHDNSKPLTAWNYTFPAGGNDAAPDAVTQQANGKASEGKSSLSRYRFSGTYAHNLLEEVERYSAVARVVSARYNLDVIHVHDWMTFPAGTAAKKVSGKTLIAHVHSTEFDRSGDGINAAVSDIEKRGLLECDAIIAVSNWTKDILVSRYGIEEKKVTVIHNGIIPREQPEGIDFPDFASHFVTFLGRVTHQKGPRFFVEAAERVLHEFPDAHFIVAGAGDLLPQMIERVAQLNMSGNFHFTGFLSGQQVDQVWSMTDVYVMPSVSEPFGIAPLEAIQGGVPVILSNQSGVSEVMPHAIKVDFWDVKALAGAICSVLRYESLSHVLRQNSKQHIQHLTWNKAARNVKALYNELTGKK